MEKNYTELVDSIKSLINAFDPAEQEIKNHISKIENAALVVTDIIDSNFTANIASGKYPELQGLQDDLCSMFNSPRDGDPGGDTFFGDVLLGINYTFRYWKTVFSNSLKDFEKETESAVCVNVDNPFYEVTEIIDNTKE